MPGQHDKATIIGMAVIASAAATLLHEGVGHGLTAWFRGDVVTELTSNHLSSLHPDRWVDAAGTLMNLLAGTIALFVSWNRGDHANIRYFFWLFAALNLLPGAGYFLFSGIFGFGDWYQVILGLPHEAALRVAMTIFGAVLYFWSSEDWSALCNPLSPNIRFTTRLAACAITPPASSAPPPEHSIRWVLNSSSYPQSPPPSVAHPG